MQNKETERKYLIEYPDIELLLRESECVKKMVQTYLLSEKGVDARVRMSVSGNKTEYTHTEKRKISTITREENERVISEEEYKSLLELADPDFLPIDKTRYCVRTGKHTAEIDVYRNQNDYAILEVELESEDEYHTLPPCVTVIREVTGEREYTNRYMALRNK